VVLVFVIVDFRAGQMRYAELASESSHAHAVIDRTENALSALKDSETGQRGFLITLDPAYLTPYNFGGQAWRDNLRSLDGLSTGDPGLAPLVKQLRDAGAAKFDEMRITLAAARGQQKAAFAEVERGVGKQYMDDARRIAAEIISREEAEYARSSALSLATENRTRWAVEAAAAAMFLLTAAGTLLLNRELERERLLAEDLEKSERKYRDLAGSLEQQVEERTKDLQRVNEELQAFGYSVSHDLRAPLRAVDGFSQILMEDHAEALGSEGREMLDRIRAGVRRMSDLIRSLLDLSRVSRVELKKQPVSISDLAAGVVENLRHADPQRRVSVNIQPGLITEGDPNLIRVVLDNLISNAWKFTSHQPEARIEVGAQDRGGRPEYFVRDNGAGFDPAYADKLFKPFQRLHSDSEFEGTGIGLATAQRVVRRHGGEIRAESENGNGAAFYFTL
jgi:signal transduction histidine kinase